MGNEGNKIKIAVNGGVGFGAKLNSKQLLTLSKYLAENEELELTTFQQLYIEIPEVKRSEIFKEFKSVVVGMLSSWKLCKEFKNL